MNTSNMEKLGRALRQDLALHEERGKAEDARNRQNVSRAIGARAESTSTRSRLLWAGAFAAVALGLALVVWPRVRHPPLDFWIEDRSGEVDEWVTAREVPQSLRFSDGSNIVVGSHATARILQVTEHGARLTLERGRIDAHVVHRQTSSWQVAAGPFVVRVTGTRFLVAWDPALETLSVQVSEGQVEVTGGGHPKHQLVAGSGLELHVAGRKGPSESPAAVPLPVPSQQLLPTASESGGEERRPEPVVEPKPDWRELSTGGRYREALRAVERQGFSGQCGLLSAQDLLSLGSTARLAGRADLAKLAYLAARKRFPSSSEAAISAFSLGRIASDAGSPAEGVGWFKQYLLEQPAGALAREASGRLIELARQTGNEPQARAAADGYLKQYPKGPHAGLARSVLSRP